MVTEVLDVARDIIGEVRLHEQPWDLAVRAFRIQFSFDVGVDVEDTCDGAPVLEDSAFFVAALLCAGAVCLEWRDLAVPVAFDGEAVLVVIACDTPFADLPGVCCALDRHGKGGAKEGRCSEGNGEEVHLAWCRVKSGEGRRICKGSVVIEIGCISRTCCCCCCYCCFFFFAARTILKRGPDTYMGLSISYGQLYLKRQIHVVHS